MSNNSPSGSRVFSSFIWSFAERCGAQAVTFIVGMILARLLTPDDYGLVAIVTVITSLLTIFVDSGLASSLVQNKNADDTDFSTVFYFNIFFCIILYIVLFFCAPWIATLYGKEQLVSLIRVLGLTIVISGLKNVQHAYVSKTMQFRLFFFSTLFGTVIAAIVGIAMAYAGFGVWAIVIQHITNLLIDTIVLWFTTHWRPKRLFSFPRLIAAFKYGWKILAAALLSTLNSDLRQMIIGFKHTASDLSYYNKGSQFPSMITSNINAAIDNVLFPAMASVQNEQDRIRELTRKSIRVSSYLMLPFLVGLAVCGEPIVRLLLTDKWISCVPYLQVFSFTAIFKPIHTANLNAIKALGRSDIFLKLDIFKKIVDIAILLFTIQYGPFAIALGLIVSNFSSQIINTYPNRKLLNYTYFQQLHDILPFFALAAVMGACVYTINFLHLADWLTLLIQIVLGAAIYIVGSKLLRFDTFNYVIAIVKNTFLKSKQKSQ